MASQNRLITWIIVVFSSFRIITFGGIMKVNGVMLQYTVHRMDTSTTLVAWAYTLQCSISFLIAPACGTLLRYFSYRTLGVIGGFLSGFGFVCSGLFASQVWHLFIFHAIAGLGFGLICLPPFLYMHIILDESTYTIISSSMSLLTYVGVAVLPVVMNWLIDNYGYSNALVLMGLLLMNNIILGVSMRPTKETDIGKSRSSDGVLTSSELHPLDRHFFIFSALFRHKKFAACMLFATTGMFVYSSWAVFLVSFGNDLKFSVTQSVYLSTAGGLGGVIGSLLPLFLFKIGKMNALHGCALPSALNACSLLVSVHMTNFYVVFCLMIISGFSQGCQYAAICGFIPNVLCKYHFSKGLALSYFIEGILYQLGGLVAGALTDLSGSTFLIFTVNGIICLVVAPTAFVWLCDKYPTRECYSNNHGNI